jgi:hypothetical protein
MPKSVNQSKKDVERPKQYARGGNTPMFGKGDRVKTATSDAAGKQTPAQTSQKSKDNPKAAKGGPKIPAGSIGGVARPARAGATGT